MQSWSGVHNLLKDNLRYLFLILATILIVFSTVEMGWYAGLAIAVFPLILYYLIFVVENPKWILITLFVLNYYVLGMGRYVKSIPGGIMMDSLFTLTFFIIFITAVQKNRYEWKRTVNILNACVLVWLAYCVMQIFNPEAVSFNAWLQGVRGEAIYFSLVIILAQLLFTHFEDLKLITFIWSLLVLTAVLKALMQKYIGFDAAEQYWLFVEGFARTHIIQTGIRYFSFFTDAANFGAGMGYSMVFFLLIAFVQKKPSYKIYYIVVGLLSAYGMMISGTRTAMIVPFLGFGLYAVLIRNYKVVAILSTALLILLVFFKFTMIMNGNPTIRRMRSAFNPSQDASYQLRLMNQQKMKAYMSHRYFGVGIGMGGGKAKKYAPHAYMSQIATDSWFVMIWVETGIVGLFIHIATLLIIMLYGAYIIMFKIRDHELKAYLAAFHAGISGMIAASYGNEIFGQFPNGFTIYLGMAFIYLGPYFDKELTGKDEQLKQIRPYENE